MQYEWFHVDRRAPLHFMHVLAFARVWFTARLVGCSPLLFVTVAAILADRAPAAAMPMMAPRAKASSCPPVGAGIVSEQVGKQLEPISTSMRTH